MEIQRDHDLSLHIAEKICKLTMPSANLNKYFETEQKWIRLQIYSVSLLKKFCIPSSFSFQYFTFSNTYLYLRKWRNFTFKKKKKKTLENAKNFLLFSLTLQFFTLHFGSIHSYFASPFLLFLFFIKIMEKFSQIDPCSFTME